MGAIRRLDEHLTNMIAAGEVVERPMGIVKELVENCIDAKATKIEINISSGGIDCIQIIDDGIGMDAEDAALAFERHATSKLKEVNDLWSINTMGFRGEALPSIASVSHVTMVTNNGKESNEVEIYYGKLEGVKPKAGAKGTNIQIKNLFQKTPARFKHLKSPQYEFSLISDVVQKFALSHPEIAFYLSHDGKEIFKTKGTNNLLEVLMQIYGRDAAKHAIEIATSDYDYKISGYAMQPSMNRATKYYMFLYINNRMIRNYRLQKAILDAYSSYMPKDRYPIIILNIEMDAQLVDVNVHPSKWEIRLSKEKQLEKLIYTSLENALKKGLQVSEIKKKEKEKVEMETLDFTYEHHKPIEKMHQEINESFKYPYQSISQEIPKENPLEKFKNSMGNKITKTSSQQFDTSKAQSKIYENIFVEKEKSDLKEVIKEQLKEENEIENLEVKLEIADQQEEFQEDSEPLLAVQDTKEELVYTKQEEPKIEEEQEEKEKPLHASFPEMHVIGQFHNCYILAQGEAGLYIIDQHAAQEKYHFEQIQKMIMSGTNDVQPLLIPIHVDVTLQAISMIDDLNEKMRCLGIEFEVFGEHSFICRGLPTWMQHTDEKKCLEDMIDFWQKDSEVNIEKLRKKAIATIACHSSIRFNRGLTLEEMKKVIDDLRKCEQPFHCPHGRPTFICLSDQYLFKEFQRG
ncbi:MAG: DNA mismatch repair endonuclease MutL [Erysipelotrichaceae bacterium]|nr:DNA mismatch repair endonuclease MutL [Erysipelotrichaceae bacterium]